jgi:hypothetical protein
MMLGIKIPPRDVERLRSRKQELEIELQEVNKQLQAVAVLTGSAPRTANGGGTMLDAIVHLAGEGIARKDLKTRLAQEGFTGKSLGNYLYTAVKRLKAQKKIKVTKEGLLALP